MRIQDIIKTDKDRLFVVDYECYIIFTGDSKEDIKPFIRIGNWNDMPVELIPLIENIIITDEIVGDPSTEQFNIDIRDLSTNRYIGSSYIVKRFLAYQKIFGLDLTNASIVNIEKDIPELSRKKKISTKNQFVGIFYRDGNFKTLYNNREIFNLKKIKKVSIDFNKVHDEVSKQNKKSGRYTGSGMIVLGHNPVFYYKNYFTSYLFPVQYNEELSLLNIDPAKIETLIYPSRNLINLSRLLKWKNSTGGKVTIYSNNNDFSAVKKLFTQSRIRVHDFNRMSSKTDQGLHIKQYHGSFNVKMTFRGSSSDSQLSIAFIKGSHGVKEVLSDALDAVFISCSAYEDSAMLFKSTNVPVAVIDDGNKNITRLAARGLTVLYPSIHYEFQRHTAFEEIVSLSGTGEEVMRSILNDPRELDKQIEILISEGTGSFEQTKKLYNLLSLIRLNVKLTANRRHSSRLKNSALTIDAALNRKIISKNAQRIKIIIVMYDNALCPLITDSEEEGQHAYPDEITGDTSDEKARPDDYAGFRDRVIADRIRLQKLIDIFSSSDSYRKKNGAGIKGLISAIQKRKDIGSVEDLNLDESGENLYPPAGRAEDVSGEKPVQSSGKGPALEKKKGPLFAVRIILPVILVLISALLFLLYRAGYRPDFPIPDRGKVIQSNEIDKKYSILAEKNNITIKNTDIVTYANTVALRNGYHRIAEKSIKGKNPDWIYPENIFTMLDGQRVVVSKGDTLWNLSKNKLIEAILTFRRLALKLKAAAPEQRKKLLSQMKKIAYSADQKIHIKKLEEEYRQHAQDAH